MKEREIVTERKILDVLYALSYDREIAMNTDDKKLAIQKEKEFNRLAKMAHKHGFNSKETLTADLQGRINASVETGSLVMKSFYQNCLRDLEDQ
jgi:hypothetical protein